MANNILILLPNDSLGGAEQYLKMVAQNHTSDKVTVIFLLDLKTNLWSDTSSNITKLFLSAKSKKIGLLFLFAHFLFKKNGKFDYIFTSHVYMTALMGLLIAFGLVRKNHFVARESTSIFKRFNGFKLMSYRLAYNLGYKHVDLLICQTKFMKDQLLDNFTGFNANTRLEVIPNPIDLNAIRKNEKELLKNKLAETYMVSAGRLIPEKGFDILISSFAEIAGAYPELKLIILGEGPSRAALEQQTEVLQLNDRVIMPGRVNNVYPYFKNAQLCVVSSRIEGFPNVLLQMMSQNNNIISTLCAGGIEEIPNIAKVATNSQEALTKGLEKILENKNDSENLIFDTYLQERNINSFMQKIKKHLN